ncbi:MAG TPA: 3-isopropylmalate dehydratase small subunit [Candidatus Saccharimonadales bacterium]|nr:3-isopropylmalate dehydratase small subunit [Candidatus Saccharimonadales bacterium]
MKKQKVTRIESTAIPLEIENIDTDQIIPARFLKATTRVGFGLNVFRDWRYNKDDKPNLDFVLNNPKYKGDILVAGYNFGCGSSREHAAWALSDYGFKAVISSFFADIFKNNALNNSLLPIQVTPDFLKLLFETIKKDHKTKIIIDIEKQTISVPEKNTSEIFDINPYKKICIMNGYDDIDYLLSLKKEIKTFERKRKNDFSLSFK